MSTNVWSAPYQSCKLRLLTSNNMLILRRLLALKLFFFLLLPGGRAQTRKKDVQTGRASFYAQKFHGRRTASGERYSRHALTAAHRTLPFGTLVKVTNAKNGKSVIVRINDRGPHSRSRIIDLSKAAARKIGITLDGSQTVLVQTLGMAPSTAVAEQAVAAPTIHIPKTPLHAGTYRPNGHPCTPKGYGLQVASYYSSESALYDAAAIQHAGYKEVFVQVNCTEGHEELYRVLVGQFATREKAVASQARLATKGWESFPAKHE